MISQAISSQPLRYGQFLGTTQARRDLPGFSVARMVPELPPEQVPTHTHEDASFFFLLDGVYISSAEAAGPECVGPTLIYNPAGTTHRDRFQNLAGNFLAISISRESLRHATEYVHLPERATAFRSPEVVTVAERIARECVGWEQTSALLAEGLCLELMAGVAHGGSRPLRTPPIWLRRAKELLHEQCTDSLRVIDAAATSGVHPVHFVRAFRQFFRCTPGAYVTRCRMEKAVSLLLHSDTSLADVALECGFADQSHFSKRFKRNLGLSPLTYRKLFSRRSFSSD